MRIGISIGHGASEVDGAVVLDPGAVHPTVGVGEYDTCRRIYNILGSMLHEYKPIEVVEAPIGTPLQERVAHLNYEHRENEAIDFTLELHLNGFEDISATGTECLYYPGSTTGRGWAQRMQGALLESLGLKDREIKERGDLNFLTAPSCRQ